MALFRQSHVSQVVLDDEPHEPTRHRMRTIAAMQLALATGYGTAGNVPADRL